MKYILITLFVLESLSLGVTTLNSTVFLNNDGVGVSISSTESDDTFSSYLSWNTDAVNDEIEIIGLLLTSNFSNFYKVSLHDVIDHDSLDSLTGLISGEFTLSLDTTNSNYLGFWLENPNSDIYDPLNPKQGSYLGWLEYRFNADDDLYLINSSVTNGGVTTVGIPEPDSIILLGFGGIFLLFRFRR